ncbi:MAG: purine-binding chemotaxis protein CheW [candidate division Zixibacteria bacterium]|nr:purine-binding chemotaxis protein CheW [candidate division Zixibacteria bacterium]
MDNSVTQNYSTELIQLVSFNLADEEFGVDILSVQEINRMVEITRVPQVPSYCEGVINLRGRVIPIIDLRKKFDLPVRDWNKDTRIIVCDIDHQIVGMIVDAVSEVRRIPGSTVEPPPDIVNSVNSRYIRGVAKLQERLLLFLDIRKLITEVNQEVNQLDTAVL